MAPLELAGPLGAAAPVAVIGPRSRRLARVGSAVKYFEI
jgi:hypothetical protein